MNALEFRLLLYKKQNYSYTFFKLGVSEILSFVEKLRVDVYDEDKIIKVYCADQNTLDTCYQAAVSVVSYQPIIIDKTNIKLVSKNTAELATPYPSYIDGTNNCDIKTANFVQVYTLEKSLINPLTTQTLKFSLNSGLSAGSVIFPEDCQSLTPGLVLGNKDKFTMTLDDVGNIATFLVGNLISDIQSSNCNIYVNSVTAMSGNLQMDITSVVSSMSVVTPRTIDACYIKLDEKTSAIISWASAVNPGKINMKTKAQTEVLRAKPMILKDLENYKLNYIDNMYDEIYETVGTPLENLSYYIL